MRYFGGTRSLVVRSHKQLKINFAVSCCVCVLFVELPVRLAGCRQPCWRRLVSLQRNVCDVTVFVAKLVNSVGFCAAPAHFMSVAFTGNWFLPNPTSHRYRVNANDVYAPHSLTLPTTEAFATKRNPAPDGHVYQSLLSPSVFSRTYMYLEACANILVRVVP